MLKKLLFILASVMVGLLLIVNSMGSSFYKEIVKQTANAVDEKNYLYAEQFVSYALDKDGMFYSKTNEETGMHIDIYSSIIIKNEPVKDADGKTTSNMTLLEECIQISMFHLPSDFALVDRVASENVEAATGGIRLVLAGDAEDVFLPFVEKGEDDTVISMYDYVNYYSFLPIFISYETYQEKVGDNTVSAIEVIDGDGDLVTKIESSELVDGKPLSFDTNFHRQYSELITKYNTLYRKYDENAEDAEEQVDIIRTTKEAIDKVAIDHNFVAQHSTDVIYKSSGYIWSLVITAIIFLAIDGLLGFLLFRKKKTPAYVPKRPMQYNNQKNVTPKAPEQFNRKDVFDVNEGSFVIEDQKTENLNESENVE